MTQALLHGSGGFDCDDDRRPAAMDECAWTAWIRDYVTAKDSIARCCADLSSTRQRHGRGSNDQAVDQVSKVQGVLHAVFEQVIGICVWAMHSHVVEHGTIPNGYLAILQSKSITKIDHDLFLPESATRCQQR